MKKKILILPNLHVANTSPSAGGMEISAHELAAAVALSNMQSQAFQVILAAHAGSDVLDFKGDLVRITPDETIDNFNARQQANNSALYDALNTVTELHGDISLILDQTSSFIPLLWCKKHGTASIKTLRLNGNYFNFGEGIAPGCAVHLSSYSQTLKKHACRSEVIRDFVRCDEAGHYARQNFALSVGRVCRGKGHLAALDAARELGLPLHIVGAVFEKDHALQLKEAGAILCGSLDRRQTLQKIKEAAFLTWTPEECEPGGRVVIEALRAGTTVVCRKMGIASDMIDINGSSPKLPGDLYILDKIPEELVVSYQSYGEKYLSLIQEFI